MSAAVAGTGAIAADADAADTEGDARMNSPSSSSHEKTSAVLSGMYSTSVDGYCDIDRSVV